MASKVKYTQLLEKKIYEISYSTTKNGNYFAYIRGKRCKTENEFFREISASFQFPAYFGENWPALDECLCDLEWLNVRGMLVIVDDFRCMFKGDRRKQELLIKYFGIMAEYWEGAGIPIEIIINN